MPPFREGRRFTNRTFQRHLSSWFEQNLPQSLRYQIKTIGEGRDAFSRASIWLKSTPSKRLELDLRSGAITHWGESIEWETDTGWNANWTPSLQMFSEYEAPVFQSSFERLGGMVRESFFGDLASGPMRRRTTQEIFSFMASEGYWGDVKTPERSVMGKLTRVGPTLTTQAQIDYANRVAVGLHPSIGNVAIAHRTLMNSILNAPEGSPLHNLRGYAMYQQNRDQVTLRRYGYATENDTGIWVTGKGKNIGDILKRGNLSIGGGMREQVRLWEPDPSHTSVKPVQPLHIMGEGYEQRAGYRWLNAIQIGETQPRAAYIRPGTMFTAGSPVPGSMITYDDVTSIGRRGPIVGAGYEKYIRRHIPLKENEQGNVNILQMLGTKSDASYQFGIFRRGKEGSWEKQRELTGAFIPPGESRVVGLYTPPDQEEPIPMRIQAESSAIWFTGEPELYLPSQHDPQTGGHYGGAGPLPGKRSKFGVVASPVETAGSLAFQRISRGWGGGTIHTTGGSTRDLEIYFPAAKQVGMELKSFGGVKTVESPALSRSNYRVRPYFDVGGETYAVHGVTGELKNPLDQFSMEWMSLSNIRSGDNYSRALQSEMIGEFAKVDKQLGRGLRQFVRGYSVAEGELPRPIPMDKLVSKYAELSGKPIPEGDSELRFMQEEMFQRLRGIMATDPEYTLRKYGFGEIWGTAENPNWIEMPLVQESEKALLEERFRAGRNLSSFKDAKLENYLRFTPLGEGSEGIYKFEANLGGYYGGFVSGVSAGHRSRQVRMSYNEAAALSFYPNIAKDLGVDLDAPWGSTGMMPPHARAWRTMASIESYTSDPNKNAFMYPRSQRVMDLTPELGRDLVSRMNLGDVNYMELQKEFFGDADILRETRTGALVPSPRVIHQLSEAVEAGYDMGDISPTWVSGLGKRYPDILREMVSSEFPGTVGDKGTAYGKFRGDLNQIKTSLSKTAASLAQSAFLPSALGGRFAGLLGIGTHSTAMSEQDRELVLRNLAKTMNFKSGSERRDWLRTARGQWEEMIGIPGLGVRSPTLNAMYGAMPIQAMTRGQLLRNTGMILPAQASFRGGKVYGGHAGLSGAAGATGLAMGVGPLGDWDYDQWFEALQLEAYEGGIRFNKDPRWQQIMSYSPKQKVQYLQQVLSGQIGGFPDAPGGGFEAVASAFKDIIEATQGTRTPHPGTSMVRWEELWRQSSNRLLANIGKGVAHNMLSRVEAGQASLGWFNAPSLARGTRSFQEYLDYKFDFDATSGSFRHLEQIFQSAHFDVNKRGLAVLKAKTSQTDQEWPELWSASMVTRGSVNSAMVAQLARAAEADEMDPLYAAGMFAMQSEDVSGLAKRMESEGIYKALMGYQTDNLGYALSSQYDVTQSPIGVALFGEAVTKGWGWQNRWGRERKITPKGNAENILPQITQSVIQHHPILWQGREMSIGDFVRDIGPYNALLQHKTRRGGTPWASQYGPAYDMALDQLGAGQVNPPLLRHLMATWGSEPWEAWSTGISIAPNKPIHARDVQSIINAQNRRYYKERQGPKPGTTAEEFFTTGLPKIMQELEDAVNPLVQAELKARREQPRRDIRDIPEPSGIVTPVPKGELPPKRNVDAEGYSLDVKGIPWEEYKLMDFSGEKIDTSKVEPLPNVGDVRGTSVFTESGWLDKRLVMSQESARSGTTQGATSKGDFIPAGTGVFSSRIDARDMPGWSVARGALAQHGVTLRKVTAGGPGGGDIDIGGRPPSTEGQWIPSEGEYIPIDRIERGRYGLRLQTNLGNDWFSQLAMGGGAGVPTEQLQALLSASGYNVDLRIGGNTFISQQAREVKRWAKYNTGIAAMGRVLGNEKFSRLALNIERELDLNPNLRGGVPDYAELDPVGKLMALAQNDPEAFRELARKFPEAVELTKLGNQMAEADQAAAQLIFPKDSRSTARIQRNMLSDIIEGIGAYAPANQGLRIAAALKEGISYGGGSSGKTSKYEATAAELDDLRNSARGLIKEFNKLTPIIEDTSKSEKERYEASKQLGLLEAEYKSKELGLRAKTAYSRASNLSAMRAAGEDVTAEEEIEAWNQAQNLAYQSSSASARAQGLRAPGVRGLPRGQVGRLLRSSLGGFGWMYMAHMASLPMGLWNWGVEGEPLRESVYNLAAQWGGPGVPGYDSLRYRQQRAQLAGGMGVGGAIQSGILGLPQTLRDIGGIGMAGLTGYGITTFLASNAAGIGMEGLATTLGGAAGAIGGIGALVGAGLTVAGWRADQPGTKANLVSGVLKGGWSQYFGMVRGMVGLTRKDFLENVALAKKIESQIWVGDTGPISFTDEELPTAISAIASHDLFENLNPEISTAVLAEAYGGGRERFDMLFKRVRDVAGAIQSGRDVVGLARAQYGMYGNLAPSDIFPRAVSLARDLSGAGLAPFRLQEAGMTFWGGMPPGFNIGYAQQINLAGAQARGPGAGIQETFTPMVAGTVGAAYATQPAGALLQSQASLWQQSIVQGYGYTPREITEEGLREEWIRQQLEGQALGFDTTATQAGLPDIFARYVGLLGRTQPREARRILSLGMERWEADGALGDIYTVRGVRDQAIYSAQTRLERQLRERGATESTIGLTVQAAQTGGTAGFGYVQSLLGGDPFAIAFAASQAPDVWGEYNILNMPLQGGLSHRAWGTTSLATGGETPAQRLASSMAMAEQMWGPQKSWGQQGLWRLPMAQGLESTWNGMPVPQGLQGLGGSTAQQWMQATLGYQSQMASLGNALQQIQLNYAFQTGIGLEAYSTTDPRTGKALIHGTGKQGFWGIQDAQNALQRRQMEWQFQNQLEQLELSDRHFQENWLLTQRGVQMQRGFTREDWAYQDMMRGMQWQWNVEDFQEESRFLTGRQRKKAERQFERASITKEKEDEQIDKKRQQQKELWKLEDERFELQRKQHQEQLDFQKEAIEMQKKFWEEGEELRKEYEDLQRAFMLEQMELQKAAIGAQAHYAQLQYEMMQDNMVMGEQQATINDNYKTLNKNFNALLNVFGRGLSNLTGQVSKWAASVGLKIPSMGFDPIDWLIEQDPTSEVPGPSGRSGGGSTSTGADTGSGEGGSAPGDWDRIVTSSDNGVQIDQWQSSSATSTKTPGRKNNLVVNVYVGNEKLENYIVEVIENDVR